MTSPFCDSANGDISGTFELSFSRLDIQGSPTEVLIGLAHRKTEKGGLRHQSDLALHGFEQVSRKGIVFFKLV
jgi:hypothetical protein